MYAVLDIEATGGKRGEESIIEIAIFLYNGEEVIDQLISLVQPDREIDLYVQKLTQITPKMVKTAPKFHELAKRIIEITEGAVLIGHNVEFDYRMLKQEFLKLGYTYYRETIDTLSLSEKYFPDAESYSLGKLCKSIGIPVSDRHRASGDARATLQLFQIIQDKDLSKDISIKDLMVKETHLNASKFDEFLKDLPNEIGIYYILNDKKQIIYLSRSSNIAQSVRKLLTGKTNLSNKIKQNVSKIIHETTGNELVSWLKEYQEIKTLKPQLNEIKQKSSFPFSIYIEENKKPYKQILIGKLDAPHPNELLRISSYNKAMTFVSLISEDFELCAKINGISTGNGPCLAHTVGECHGACIGKETPEEYNKRIDQLQAKLSTQNRNILIIDKGRRLGEKSFIWVKYGVCMGYGYFELNEQINTEDRIRERMIPIEDSLDVNSIVKGFLFTEKYLEISSLEPKP